MDEYIRVSEIAERLCVKTDTLCKKIRSKNFPLYKDVNGASLTTMAVGKRILEEYEYFEYDCWTGPEVAKLIHRSVSTIQRLVERGYLKPCRCRWLSHHRIRYTQEAIEELLYRLEFSDPDWHDVKDIIGMLNRDDREFPGVEAYEKMRAESDLDFF